MRESGILFPIFSVPSKYGIGCFSREAYDFVDFLEKSGQGFWQILPVGPTGFGDSPYQPFSAFAGNPYFICIETLIEDGLLNREDVEAVNFGDDETKVDYGAIYESRQEILKKAYEKFVEKLQNSKKDKEIKAGSSTPSGIQIPKNDNKKEKSLGEEFDAFLKMEEYWIEDYALFMALKDEAGGASWLDWDDELRTRDEKAMEKAKKELADKMQLYYFEQFEFDRQWRALKAYANEKNVKIIGDIPFYVAMDSSDAWSHPEVFMMDKDLKPNVVAGCPPDAFSPTGQLWGNPIYDWAAEKKRDYDWWLHRMYRTYAFYDVIRIDHFHGFCEYYAVPYGDETAEKGKQEKGPGIDFFNVLKKKVDNLNIIAEDLGNNTPENEKLLKDSGFPGMKVLQYGFTSWDSYYVNHRHINNCVVYTGTHDNTPTRAWVEEINEGERDFTRRYINSMNTDYNGLVWDLIREAYRSVADLCIVPLQDYLCFGKEARINTPGAPDGNWQWRLRPNFLSDDLARSIRGLTELYSRIPKTEG
ncbi:MAG: 4-alpha-glucanotransferase [Eubacterium sp.]|nr:4-alpha-glucanotransferase [Eubacterium sp.]